MFSYRLNEKTNLRIPYKPNEINIRIPPTINPLVPKKKKKIIVTTTVIIEEEEIKPIKPNFPKDKILM
jgi:hypothetical protein